ncbi:hypothetical protein AVEN_274178-1 [Araneus ventricosus]|uniref:Reverse transcriptase domain-containing protein n=1 Tax=Araneus ventricosus TaxID=182803 RepID=A0A4Y2JRI3_ARAVE|nr:hypothetical protein AVEN_274178-1 [Araneus ventricosus]
MTSQSNARRNVLLFARFRNLSQGISHGSVVDPTLWNIYVNRVLEINSERVCLQAFADDLALVTAGSVRKELEINTNEVLELIHLTLVELKLELSVGKCQGLAFRSLVRHQKRKGQNIFKRKLIFKINATPTGGRLATTDDSGPIHGGSSAELVFEPSGPKAETLPLGHHGPLCLSEGLRPNSPVRILPPTEG